MAFKIFQSSSFRESAAAFTVPKISLSILTAGIFVGLRQTPWLKPDAAIPTLPVQEKNKPVILFDFRDFLTRDKLSIRHPHRLFTCRKYCREFLFNALDRYELIALTDTPPMAAKHYINFIDPFSCISYRLSLSNKQDLTKDHLNRPLSKLIVLSTKPNEFSEDFNRNTLMIPKWKGGADSRLLDLLHFMNNLQALCFSERQYDVRRTLDSYRSKDFFATFRKVQKRLYNQRNMFATTTFECKLEDVNRERIESYQQAEQQMKKMQNKTVSLSSLVKWFARSMFF